MDVLAFILAIIALAIAGTALGVAVYAVSTRGD